jgi:hypothetical protein
MKNTNDKSLETGTFWLYISGTAKDKGYMTLDILNISTQKIKKKKSHPNWMKKIYIPLKYHGPSRTKED